MQNIGTPVVVLIKQTEKIEMFYCKRQNDGYFGDLLITLQCGASLTMVFQN